MHIVLHSVDAHLVMQLHLKHLLLCLMQCFILCCNNSAKKRPNYTLYNGSVILAELWVVLFRECNNQRLSS